MQYDPVINSPADGICTFVELNVPMTARLAKALKLPGLPPVAVQKARNKHTTRAEMAIAGLPTPANFLIELSEQLEDAAARVGFPAVIKPVSGAASLGVKRVDSLEELVASYAEIHKQLNGLVVWSGALVDVRTTESDEPNPSSHQKQVRASGKADMTVMMEQV